MVRSTPESIRLVHQCRFRVRSQFMKSFPGNDRNQKAIQYTLDFYLAFRHLSFVSSWFFLKNTLRDRLTLR